MKLHVAAFMAVASSNIAVVNPHELRHENSQKRFLQNNQPSKSNHQKGKTSKKQILSTNINKNERITDVGILSDRLVHEQNWDYNIDARILSTTTLYSCQGESACKLANNITYGNNTCNGFYACCNAAISGGCFAAGNGTCVGLRTCVGAGGWGTFKARSETCQDDYACYYAGFTGIYFNAGDSTCVGTNACKYAARHQGRFRTGDGSCIGAGACEEAARFSGTFQLYDASCLGQRACQNGGKAGTFRAGHSSCSGDRACRNNGSYGGIFYAGDARCQGSRSCYQAGSSPERFFNQGGNVTIGKSSCRGTAACVPKQVENHFTIGDNSCACDYCCQNLMDGSQIGDCQCNDLSDGCSNATEPVVMLGSCQPSSTPSTRPSPGPSPSPSGTPSFSSAPGDRPSVRPSSSPSSTPSMFVPPSQNLAFDASHDLLGLSDSTVAVSVAHLVNNDVNEVQDLVFNISSNQLTLTSSSSLVDLSRLDNPEQQHLIMRKQGVTLAITDSDIDVDISSIAIQDLSIHQHTIDISGRGSGIDLSFLRLTSLQASIDEIDGDKTPTERSRYLNRKDRKANGRSTRVLKGGKSDPPEIYYGGNAASGWSLISSGRLIGMGVTANYGLEKGALEISIVDCTNNDAMEPLGSVFDVVTLEKGLGRSNFTKFETPIPVEAGTVLCFQAVRLDKVDSEGDDNAASLILTLEQW